VAVILAADSLSIAAVAANTDDGDRRAGEPNENVQVLEDDADEGKNGSNS
jgi:hypothetical protein